MFKYVRGTNGSLGNDIIQGRCVMSHWLTLPFTLNLTSTRPCWVMSEYIQDRLYLENDQMRPGKVDFI